MIYLRRNSIGFWDVMQHASLGNIERERNIGHVMHHYEDASFTAHTDNSDTVAVTNTLPAAIQALIDLHKMTDYQFAPWPAMEEDEE